MTDGKCHRNRENKEMSFLFINKNRADELIFSIYRSMETMNPSAEHGMGRPGRVDVRWQLRATGRLKEVDRARISFSLPLLFHCSCVQLWESVN
jgi:hypothetical protein